MSTRLRVIALAVSAAAVLTAAAPAQAQTPNEPRTALTLGYPGTIGVLFKVTERVAVRPELDLSGASADETSSTSLAVGASVLFYWPPVDDVRFYVSPRVVYHHSSASTDDLAFDVELDRSATSVSGSIGAEFNPRPRFGIFGEVGFQYSRSSSELTFLDRDRTIHGWGLRSGVGVILRF
jgi:hypothetical protein